jgi:hypothetical protein
MLWSAEEFRFCTSQVKRAIFLLLLVTSQQKSLSWRRRQEGGESSSSSSSSSSRTGCGHESSSQLVGAAVVAAADVGAGASADSALADQISDQERGRLTRFVLRPFFHYSRQLECLQKHLSGGYQCRLIADIYLH